MYRTRNIYLHRGDVPVAEEPELVVLRGKGWLGHFSVGATARAMILQVFGVWSWFS